MFSTGLISSYTFLSSVCLFARICLSSDSEIFILIDIISPSPMKGFIFYLWFNASNHWVVGDLCMPHLLWHGTSVFMLLNDRPVTFIPDTIRLAVKLSIVFINMYFGKLSF